MISEQDNSPEAVKGRVRSITKSIRYKARKEGGNMIKAFNDHMSSAGSGIGAAERQMIKKSLGLSEKFSNWRSDLIEVMGDDEMEPKIKEKKIKNKIKINPEMSEEFEKIGGTIVEMLEVIDYDENYKPLEIETIDIIKPEPLKKEEVELDEYAAMSPQEVMLQKRKAQIDVMIAKKRKQTMSKVGKNTDEPTKTESVNGENELDEKCWPGYRVNPKRKTKILFGKRYPNCEKAKVKEELSIADQMRISREAAAKRKPYQPGDREKQRAAQIKQMVKNSKKDTRTDAQKMTDATGPRPGSRYRGD